jgi:predicted transcriptional regulator
MELWNFILNSQKRMDILEELSLANPQKSLDIAKKLEMRWQDVSTQLNLFVEKKLAVKDGTQFYLSKQGQVYKSQIKNLQDLENNIVNYSDFIEKHNIEKIPDGFVRDFLTWEKNKLNHLTSIDVFPFISKNLKGSKIEHLGIFSRISMDIQSLFSEMERNVSIRIIYPLEEKEKLGESDIFLEKVKCEIRFLERREMYCVMQICDKKFSWIGFEDQKNEFDYLDIIEGEDKRFVEWSRSNFEYLWTNAKNL